jgi:peptide/nickel transport system substrate-binding protein
MAALSACGESDPEEEAGPPPPTPTSTAVDATAAVTPPALATLEATFVTVATTAPYPPFEYFDEFGTVIGFDAAILDELMARLGRDHEFVVTNFDGMLASVAGGDFDMAISPLIQPDQEAEVVFTNPYLEVGQVLVVLANEREIQSPGDLQPGMAVGVIADSFGQMTALETLAVPETDLQFYPSVAAALQGLIDGEVRGVVIDHDDATQFAETYFQQLRVVGEPGREAWISSRQFVIAMDAARPELLAELNAAIRSMQQDGTTDQLVREWLVSDETIEAGESLVGTPDDVLVIGVSGPVAGVDPAEQPSLIGWEIKRNTMSGLIMFDAEGNLTPVLATDFPQVSPDGLEYTFVLQTGLTFPDGTPLTADDVKWSIDRASAGGNWHVNAFLKDADANFIADSDAVQVLGPNSVKIILKEPNATFLSVLATPPYFTANQACYAAGEAPETRCSGIGPYEIGEWEQGDRLLLRANPNRPAAILPPLVENVQLRFYADPAQMQNALEIEAIDAAWTGFPADARRTLAGAEGFTTWPGPNTFKSYLVFEQSQPPWDNPTIRQAAALAIDRDVLVNDVFGTERQPLFSPVPDGVPGQVPTLPGRDLAQARELLAFLGYTAETPLEITLWYLNDGRYTVLEETYARRIADQLEETGVFQVTLAGAPWETYSVQMSACEYPAFLLGWPPVGWPTRYPAAMGWMEYFVTNTDLLCSNYSSAQMDELVARLKGLGPLDFEGQNAVYAEMQTLWATEYPTLDLSQSWPWLVSRDTVQNVQIDNMGLLFYGALTKAPADEPEN